MDSRIIIPEHRIHSHDSAVNDSVKNCSCLVVDGNGVAKENVLKNKKTTDSSSKGAKNGLPHNL
jgi:hypothetical protein